MSELVERVAKAIDIAAHMGSPPEHWDLREKWEQDRFRLYARAAIAAMCEPVSDMLCETGDVPYLAFDRMIDEALKP